MIRQEHQRNTARSRKKVLICGATGRQGGATITAVQAMGDDFDIYGLSRRANPANMPAAATPVQGDLNDKASLEAALDEVGPDIFGVVCITSFFEKGVGEEGERNQGIAMAEACAKKGAQLFVYMSQISADKMAAFGCGHGRSKWDVEQALPRIFQGTKTKYAILRPAPFMDNWSTTPGAKIRAPGMFSRGKIPGPFSGDVQMYYIACDDIGRAIAAVLKAGPEGEHAGGRPVELAGDGPMRAEKTAQLCSEVCGAKYKFGPAPAFLLKLFVYEMYTMFDFFTHATNMPGEYPEAPVEATKQLIGGETVTVAEWLRANKRAWEKR